MVCDGSKCTSSKTFYQKRYHATEACVLTSNGHSVSIFSKVHSSNEKNFTAANDVTFAAMKRGVSLYKKATFAMDRGYDDNKMFLMLDELKQHYVVRLKSNRKLLLHNKWVTASELCNRRKGKIKMKLIYKGKEHDAYLSHVKVQITVSRKNVYLVLVYGITEHPMMLITNKEIKSKEDVINIPDLFFRWRIEEYFRCKKQVFKFETSEYENLPLSTH